MSIQTLTDVQLLALCVWGEARGESHIGKLAVAHVVLNRVGRQTWYGYDVRDVILKPYQFSFFNELAAVVEVDRDDPCYVVAYLAISGHTVDPTKGATHYYSRDIEAPDWTKDMKFLMCHGKHMFYKED